MSRPKQLEIKESLQDLRSIQKKAQPLIAVRLRVLIAIKEAGAKGISKRELADKVGVNHNSIQSWRNMYTTGGIEAICSHGRIGFKPSVFTTAEHLAIEQKLNDPLNGLRGYVELQNWIEKEFNKEVKYNTLLKYSIKNFGSSVKVARKSHIKKDEDAVVAFKKTSVKAVKKSANKKAPATKK